MMHGATMKFRLLLYKVIISSGIYHMLLPVTLPVPAFIGHIATVVYMTNKPSVSKK